MSSKVYVETEDQNRLRFQVELEFVQCLANPNYIHFLAQRGYFKEQKFINYLKHLLYWKQPEYARYLKYPMCLYFLDLLQFEHFRREAVNAQCCKFIDDQAILLWQHYTRRRNRMFTMNNGTIQMNPDSSTQTSSNVGSSANTNSIINNSAQMNSNNTQSNITQVTQTNGLGSNNIPMGQKVP
ncbi:mediator complex subunit 31 [Arctopsyche grandis]|uniref:mediator complex subunit 31 n=1 Tax=Arctopsyche grandis TaxID=121162 RepID=UPI00406D7568